MLGDLMARDRNPLIGTTAKAGQITVRVTARAATAAEAAALVERDVAAVAERLGELVFGGDEQTVAAVVGGVLAEAGRSVATAESCTGGMIGEMITEVPGSSEYFRGGCIAYANEAKVSALGVSEEDLAAHGAVSEPVAEAMAAGARRLFGADWAVSTTGIAGPGGGTSEKPVGLVYVGVAGPAGAEVHRHVFPGDRASVRRRAALYALNHLRLALMRKK
jgi:nicotinamide-nucleotide amidase